MYFIYDPAVQTHGAMFFIVVGVSVSRVHFCQLLYPTETTSTSVCSVLGLCSTSTNPRTYMKPIGAEAHVLDTSIAAKLKNNLWRDIERKLIELSRFSMLV